MDTKNFNQSISQTIIGCVLFYQQNSKRELEDLSNGPHYKNLSHKLSSIYRATANTQESLMNEWTADNDNPGWLLQIKEPFFIRVPAHLAAVFSTSDILYNLYSIGSKIKTTSASILYLSGSNTTNRVFQIVDDVDFCEYVPIDKQCIKDSINEKLVETGDAHCWRIRFPQKSQPFIRPFEPVSDVLSEIETLDPMSKSKSTFKIDYIVRILGQRIFDASNVLIICDTTYSSTGFDKTFAHQEVQITPTDVVPNKLDDVMALGKHVTWLTSKVESYSKKGNIPKMLKRAVSLARVCWMRNYTEEILNLLDNSTYLIDKEIQTIQELRQKAETCGLNSNWDSELKDLLYYEELATHEREKFKLKEARFFPEGADSAALSIKTRLFTELNTMSHGSFKL